MTTTSRFLGVEWSSEVMMWYAKRDMGGPQAIVQGYFEDEMEAAEAADRILKTHGGDLSLLNFNSVNQEGFVQNVEPMPRPECKYSSISAKGSSTFKNGNSEEKWEKYTKKRGTKRDSDSDYEDEPPPRTPPQRRKRKRTFAQSNNGAPPRHGYYGICKMPRSGYEKWQARRRHPVTKKYVTNGVYTTKIEAAKASDIIWMTFKDQEGWEASKLNFADDLMTPPKVNFPDQLDDLLLKLSDSNEDDMMSITEDEFDESDSEYSKERVKKRVKNYWAKHVTVSEDPARSPETYDCQPHLRKAGKKAYRKREKKVMKKGSPFIGVHYRNGRYKVVRFINQVVVNGGDFDDELDAAMASDNLVRKHKAWGCRLNFPREGEEERRKEMRSKRDCARKKKVPEEVKLVNPKRQKSKYVGVEPAGDGRWRAQRCINGDRYVSQGTFACDIQAAHASDNLVRDHATNSYATLNFPTAEEQRKKSVERKTSKYKGVHYTKKGLWRASRSIGGRKIMGGEFENELDAARASDALAREHGSTGTLNFPTDDDEYTPVPYKGSSTKPKPAAKKKSKYIGVTWNWRTRKWSAERAILGNKVHGGQWSDEEDAARASDKIARESSYFRGRFNFPTSDDERRPKQRKKRKKIEGPCLYFGVSIRGDRYYVSRTIRGKHYSGGSHDDEMEAVRASDNIVRREGAHGICKINIPTPRDLELIQERRRTKYEQQKNISSKYIGVSWKANENRWVAHRMINGIQTHGGIYESEIEAAKASDTLARRNSTQSNKLNFPTTEELSRDFSREHHSGTVRAFFGVTRCGSKWKAERQLGNRRIFAGLYDDMIDAARASDALVIKQGARANHLPLNFPERKRKRVKIKTSSKPSSQYIGVQWSNNASKWQAERTINGMKIMGGLFDSEMVAVRAADDIVRREQAYHCEINFPTNHEIELRRKALMSRLKTGFFGVRLGGFGTFHGARRVPETGETIRSKDFSTKIEAARASDDLWRQINCNNPDKAWTLRINFPERETKTVIDLTAERADTSKSKRMPPSNGYFGVRRSLCGWEAVRMIDGKLKYNGLHQTVELAAQASDELWKNHNGDPKELNFPEHQVRQAKVEQVLSELVPNQTAQTIDLTEAKNLQKAMTSEASE